MASDPIVPDTKVIDTGPRTRLVLGIVTLIINFIIIGWCLKYGNSANLLHQNAMSWSYILSTLVLGGLGFGSIVPLILPYFKK